MDGGAMETVDMPWHAHISGMQEAAFKLHLEVEAQAQAEAAAEGRTSTAARFTTSTPATIRITTYFDDTVQALSSANQTLVQNTVATAILVLQKFYRVNMPVSGALILHPAVDCNGGQYAVPAQLKNNTGQPNTDLYVIVRANFSDQCSGAVAWAFSCSFDPTTSRPVLGYVNICPAFFDDGQFVEGLRTRAATVVHEMTHCMGFTSFFFDTMLNEQLNATDAYGDTVLYISSTATVALTRSFFNCSSLVGAQLEDQGGSGSKNSHWDYRIFQGELMSPSGGYLISNFTLGVMADLGWYAPRFFFAAPFTRGMNAGCPFHTQLCDLYMTNNDPGEQLYCGSGAGTCTDQFTKTRCSGSNFVFNKPAACQVTMNYGNKYSGDCRLATNGGFPYDYTGSSSMCYAAAFQASSSASVVTKAACIDTTCTAGGAVVLVAHPQGGGTAINVSCPTGTTVNLTALAGSAYPHNTVVTCPPNGPTCGTLACNPSCNAANGQCINGACVCFIEWMGPDCDTHVSQVSNFDLFLPTAPPSPPAPPLSPPPFPSPHPPPSPPPSPPPTPSPPPSPSPSPHPSPPPPSPRPPPAPPHPAPPRPPSPSPVAALDPTQPQIKLTVQTTQQMDYTALAAGTATRHLLAITLSSYQADFVTALASVLGISASSINITSMTGDSTTTVLVFTVLPNAATGAAAVAALSAFTSNAFTALGSAFTTKYGITGVSATVTGTTTVTLVVPAPPPSPPLAPSANLGKGVLVSIIVGVAVGAVAAIALIVLIIWWLVRSRRAKQISPTEPSSGKGAPASTAACAVAEATDGEAALRPERTAWESPPTTQADAAVRADSQLQSQRSLPPHSEEPQASKQDDADNCPASPMS